MISLKQLQQEEVTRFHKEFIESHPGDSGYNGGDPQEPVYHMNFDPDDTDGIRDLLKFLTESNLRTANLVIDAVREEMGKYKCGKHKKLLALCDTILYK